MMKDKKIIEMIKDMNATIQELTLRIEKIEEKLLSKTLNFTGPRNH